MRPDSHKPYRTLCLLGLALALSEKAEVAYKDGKIRRLAEAVSVTVTSAFAFQVNRWRTLTCFLETCQHFDQAAKAGRAQEETLPGL